LNIKIQEQQMSSIEIAATFFGLLCVWLTIKENIWCWPVGIVQVVLFVLVFYKARLYSDVLLHIIYVFLNIYGWYHWMNKANAQNDLKVTSATKAALQWVLVCLLGTISLGFLMNTYTNASMAYSDSFIASTSLVAQWLMARKKLESWLFWIAVDLVAVVVYWANGLYLTSGLYTMFLIMAAIGFFEWKKALSKASFFGNQ